MKLDLEALDRALAGPGPNGILKTFLDALRLYDGPLAATLPGAPWRALRLASPVAERLHPATVARLEAGANAYPDLDPEPVYQAFEAGEPDLSEMLLQVNALLAPGTAWGLRRGPVCAPAGYTGLVAQFPPPSHILPALALAERFRAAAPLSHPVWNALLLQLLVLRVHPFMDGNGRTARALVNYELRRHGLLRASPIPTRKALDANRANDILLRLAITEGSRPVSAVTEALSFDLVLLTLALVTGSGAQLEAPCLSSVAPVAVGHFDRAAGRAPLQAETNGAVKKA